MQKAKNTALSRLSEIQQGGSKNLREKIGKWLRENIHPDLSGVQFLHSDRDGKFVNPPEGGWPSDQKEFIKALADQKEKIYERIIALHEEGYFKLEAPEVVEKPKTTHKSKAEKAEPEVDEAEDLVDIFDDDDMDDDAPITPPDVQEELTPPEEENEVVEELEEHVQESVRESVPPSPSVRVANDKAALLEQLFSDTGISEERVIELIEERATKIVDERFAKLKEAL